MNPNIDQEHTGKISKGIHKKKDIMGQFRLECKTEGNLVQPTAQNIFSYEI